MLLALLLGFQQPNLWLTLKDEYEAQSKVSIPVLTPNSTSVPPGFDGDPPLAFVFNYAKTHTAKDRFETTDQFAARMKIADQQPILGALTFKDYFAFKPSEVKEHDYDADTGTASIFFSDAGQIDSSADIQDLTDANPDPYLLGSYRLSIGSYTASNGFGAEFEVIKDESVRVALNLDCGTLTKAVPNNEVTLNLNHPLACEELKFKMPAEDAKKDLDKLQLLFVGKVSNIDSGPVTIKTFTHKPTTDYRVDETYTNFMISFHPEVIWVYDPDSGAIVYRLSLAQGT